MKKLLILIFLIVICTTIQLFFPQLHLIKISFFGYSIQFGLYICIALLCTKWAIQRSFYKLKNFFIDQRAIKKLSKSILYPNNLLKIKVPAKFQILHIAILIKNKLNIPYETNILPSEYRFYLMHQSLLLAIKANNYMQARNLVLEIYNIFPKFIGRISEEIIAVGKYCIKNNLDFNISFKNNKYKLEIEKATLNTLTNENEKLKKIKELIRKAPNDKELHIEYIKLCPEIEKLSTFFNRSPNRLLAYELVKIKQDNDTFNLAQQLTKNIPDTNIEKLWFLTIVATELKFNKYINELITKLLKLHEHQAIYKFIIQHYNTFSDIPEVVECVQKG